MQFRPPDVLPHSDKDNQCTLDIPVPLERKPPSGLRRLLGPTNHIPKVQVAALSLEVAARRFSI